MSIFNEIFDNLSLLVYPKRCRLCGEIIELDEDYCEICKNVNRIKTPVCFHCGYSKEDCVCKKHKHEYKAIVAPYYYENSIIKAVHNFKGNRKNTSLADNFSSAMLDVIGECYCDISFDIVAFVPLRPLHQFNRGFNQSELLANKIAASLELPVEPVLYKARYTGVQHHKSAKQRKADTFGAYDVYEEYQQALDGKTILLIDDIKTTGATLNECAKMLNIYGAKDVYACTFAIAKITKD